MLDCQEIIDRLFDFLDKEMEEADQAEFKKHMDLCRQCFSRIEFELMLREKIRQKTNHRCPEEVKKRICKLIENF